MSSDNKSGLEQEQEHSIDEIVCPVIGGTNDS
jgi:hypothetical protein